MFSSQTLVPGLVFLGEKGAGRWCETREAVTLLITNSTSEFEYTLDDVRNSVASDVERLNGYDDACILEDLPASMGRNGPYRVTMAAAAALSLIEAEGVSLFHYDSVNGLENELDFEPHVRYVQKCFRSFDHFYETRAGNGLLEYVQGFDKRAALPRADTCKQILEARAAPPTPRPACRSSQSPTTYLALPPCGDPRVHRLPSTPSLPFVHPTAHLHPPPPLPDD